jgi:hypothetical protein
MATAIDNFDSDQNKIIGDNKMIKTKEDLELQVIEIKHCIQHTSIDLLDDPNVTKCDLIVAVIEGVYRWKEGMLIIIEEENNNER